MNRLLIAAAACALLAGCKGREQASEAQNAGNVVMPSAETRTAGLGEPADAARRTS